MKTAERWIEDEAAARHYAQNHAVGNNPPAWCRCNYVRIQDGVRCRHGENHSGPHEAPHPKDSDG